MTSDEMLEELKRDRKRLEKATMRLEAAYVNLFLAMPGSLTQYYSTTRWELNPEKLVSDLDKDYDEYIDEMSQGGKKYRERR